MLVAISALVSLMYEWYPLINYKVRWRCISLIDLDLINFNMRRVFFPYKEEIATTVQLFGMPTTQYIE